MTDLIISTDSGNKVLVEFSFDKVTNKYWMTATSLTTGNLLATYKATESKVEKIIKNWKKAL